MVLSEPPRTFFRNRYQDDDFDLDLTYITDKIIVMGNPYNNDSLNQVRSFLSSKHAGHHRIYNLASEEDFNIEVDLDNVESFPIPSGNPCSLQVIIKFCSALDVYLNLKRENVVVIHCRTGKGRSCFMTACHLLHSGVFTTADEALQFVNRQRTPVRLNALSVPSQIRYLHYYEALLRAPQIAVPTLRINHIRMTTIPSFSASIVNSGCSPHVVISVLARRDAAPQFRLPSSTRNDSNNDSSNGTAWLPKQIYRQLDHEPTRKLRRYETRRDEWADFDLSPRDVRVRGDICLSLFSGDEKMAQIYFHTGFVEGNYLCFNKAAVDIAAKDKECYTFDSNFKVEVFLQRVAGNTAINALTADGRSYDFDASIGDSESFLGGGGGGGGPTAEDTAQSAAVGAVKNGLVEIDESDEDNDDPYDMI